MAASKPIDTKTSASPSCPRIPTSSPVTISQGASSCLRTRSASRAANDPAKATFMRSSPLGSVELVVANLGRQYCGKRRRHSITCRVVMASKSGFPSRLTGLRKQRGVSQLQLAATADCSQRHISFLELGRTRPSREMVQRLSMALGLTLRQANELLLAAGFAPIWSETAYDAEALAPIRQALDFMLEQQEPYPAVVLDRRWNLVQANRAAVKLMEVLVGPIAPGMAINLADALVAAGLLRPLVKNWPEAGNYFGGTGEGR